MLYHYYQASLHHPPMHALIHPLALSYMNQHQNYLFYLQHLAVYLKSLPLIEMKALLLEVAHYHHRYHHQLYHDCHRHHRRHPD